MGLTLSLGAEEASAGGACSVRSLNGTYGFYRTGRGAFGGPLVGQGVASFDGAGNWSAVVNNVRDGDVSLGEEFAGTYSVEADCSGVLFVDGAALERIAIVDHGKSYYAINVGGGATIYLVATKIHEGRREDHAH